ncbi:hypothetical protein CQR46_0963 [Bifidobacterium pseudolongum subsp. globosum]|uniref:Uncharacterized protein n=1 Tax=Bifidobacterium pseudolongum subsp. globosum TaxID=1690 RepID=A0A2N3QHJ6_9BIFI|nr:hypothetical protein [Bifidobacterium pseudolongum]PKU90767.1 hypothetical protein CQR46_0963 [Bifidobacterium pseudolongum subsp. globosum]
MSTALGVRQDSKGNGLTAADHRHIISANWQSDGIVTGLKLSGSNTLAYNVSAGVAVIQPDGQAGEAVEVYWPGGSTPTVAAGNPSLPRIDLIWIEAHDLDKGDSDNHVVLGVTQGDAASDPDLPLDKVPHRALVLGGFTVPAAMGRTSAAAAMDQPCTAISYGASLGRLVHNVRNYEGPANFADHGKDYYEQESRFYLRQPRQVELRYRATACACRHDDITKPTENADQMACWYVGIQIDGKDVQGAGGQFQVSRAWQPVSLSQVVDLAAGWHTVRTRNHRVQWGENVFFVCHSDAHETYIGRTLDVWDRGPAITVE